MSAISCFALKAVDDLIHKQYTTLLRLLINLHMKWASPIEGHGATPACSLLKPNSIETLLNELFN